MTAPARTAATPPATGPTSRPAGEQRPGGPAQAGWRRFRVPAGIAAVVLAGGLLIALISQLSQPRPNGYLDPASKYFDGSHALYGILGDRGFRVTPAYSPGSAIAAVRRAAAADGGPLAVTLIITSPGLISPDHAAALARTRANLVLVAPGRRALAKLAPAVTVAGGQASLFSARSLAPRCGLPAARLAGAAQVNGIAYLAPPAATRCYPGPGRSGYALVGYTAARRRITVLGSGGPLSNDLLGSDGNAALVLNVLRAHRDIVWLVPQPTGSLPRPSSGAGRHRGPRLIPWEAELVILQLAIAVAAVVAWRSRRLGPLIAERLPVVIRASETVEGHGRLYQARRARGRAAAALRSEFLDRALPALGLVRDAPPQAVSEALAGRTRYSAQEISATVYGPVRGTDDDLVGLARSLDELDREVRAQ